VKSKMFRACSIDVGKVNLGIYVEEFSRADNGQAIYLQRVDLTLCKKERVTVTFLKRMFDFLDSIKTHLEKCDYFVIEKQMRTNPEAQFVDHALQSYFLIHYKDKQVVSFSSKNKTHLFDDTKMTKYQRKKWAVEKAIKMFTDRGDTERLDYIKSLKKKDDASDAVCQLDAFKTIFFSQKTTLTKAFKEKGISLDSLEEKMVEKPKKKPRVKKESKPTETKEENPTKVPKEKPEVIPKEKPKRVYKKKSQEVSEKEVEIQQPIKTDTQEVPKEKPKRVYKKKPQEVSQKKPQEVSQKKPKEVAEVSPESVENKTN
jgi:Poxvirus A22 protein